MLSFSLPSLTFFSIFLLLPLDLLYFSTLSLSFIFHIFSYIFFNLFYILLHSLTYVTLFPLTNLRIIPDLVSLILSLNIVSTFITFAYQHSSILFSSLLFCLRYAVRSYVFSFNPVSFILPLAFSTSITFAYNFQTILFLIIFTCVHFFASLSLLLFKLRLLTTNAFLLYTHCTP